MIRFPALRASACVFAIAAGSIGLAGTASAQDTNEEKAESVIIVTGSSLRNVAPVGSTVQALSRDDLEATNAQTVQQVLQSIPAVVGNNQAGQGGYGSFDGSGTNAPTIHSLGASASNSTLVLLNGHRLPVGGVNHVLADPNIVAPLALERVEVLADGASSVYGSDAVAGVINFITRRNFDGVEASFQAGFGDEYDTKNAGILFGTTWDSGSALVSYNFSDRSNLLGSARDFNNLDHRSQGGSNLASFGACRTPVIGVGGGMYYLAPYTAAVTGGEANEIAASDPNCDPRSTYTIIPADQRHNVLVSVQQDLGDRLTFTADAIYSNRESISRNGVGSIRNVTIYQDDQYDQNGNITAYANPFFVDVTGTGATSATLSFDTTDIIGGHSEGIGSAETLYFRGDFDYEISDGWALNVGGVYGRDRARTENIGGLCGSCAQLALNGITSARVDGDLRTVTQVLTTENAFDPFNGQTSAATLATLTDSRRFTQAIQQLTNFYAGINGDLFELPGGSVKVAVGGEYIKYNISQDQVSPTNLGPSSSNSRFLHLDYERDVKSAYGEIFIPVISPEMDVPGFYSLELNLSGRVDDYSDFGSTTNPKVAANWEPFEGLRIRGNWSQSFVAPALTSTGSNEFGQTAESSFGGAGGGFDVPYSVYPDAALIPGCMDQIADGNSTTCAFDPNAANPIAGVQVNGGNANLGPQTGESWSLGADFTPTFAPGLRLSVTYWDTKLRGGVTAPSTGLVLSSIDLADRLVIYPDGLTPTERAAFVGTLPQNAPLPTTPIYYTFDFRQGNVVNLNVAGIDFDASYRIDTESAGTFRVGGSFSKKTKFDGFNGASGEVFDALGTAGVFTTFQAIEWAGRVNLGWELGGLSVNAFANYTGGYTNRGLFGSDLSRNPVIRNSLGTPIGGGDPVDSFTTIDLNISYDFEDLGGVDVTLFADARNLFDTDPPFVNNGRAATFAGSGYDSFNASPIGRVITLGIRASY